MYCSDERGTVATSEKRGSKTCYSTVQVLTYQGMGKDGIGTSQEKLITFRSAHCDVFTSTISMEWLALLPCFLTLSQGYAKLRKFHGIHYRGHAVCLFATSGFGQLNSCCSG